MATQRPETAFVLSGGASLGAIQVGMIRALYERGIAPDLIIGASVGAMNGAFIASRPATEETADELASVWRDIHGWQVFPLGPLSGFLGFFGARDYLMPNGRLRELVTDNIEFGRLEDAPIPFHVIATELLSGRELRLSRGDALRAVLASIAIPGVFPAIEWDGRQLIDGGVSNNTPITDAIELGAERVYVLPTGSACDLPDAPHGAVAMLLHAMSVLMTSRLLVEAELLRDQAELIILPPPCPLGVTPIDFSHTDELIRRSYEEARDYLDVAETGGTPEAVPVPGRQRSLAA
jgi:NTE family protein